MAQQIRFIIDGADRGQPGNPEDFGVTVTEDDSIGGRFVSYNGELRFSGALYSYLFNKLRTSGYCELITVQVQYSCTSGSWQRLADGYIVVPECSFDLDKCIVTAKIYDDTFSTKINNNKGIPFSMNLTETKNGVAITPPTNRSLRLFNPADPLNVDDAGRGVSLYDAFAHLVACMSDDLVDFDSSYLATTLPDTDMLVLTNGKNIRTNLNTEIIASFEQLYNALRRKVNVQMGFVKQSNGRPMIRIEQPSYWDNLAASVNLYDQPSIQMTFDTPKLYASVRFGSDVVTEQGDCGDDTQACTFAQTPFRGFREEAFGFGGECNTANELDLVSQDVIFDTNTIEDIYRFGNSSHDLANIILQCSWLPSVGNSYFEANQYDPYSIGQSVYNGGFTNANVSSNWLSGYPSSLNSFLEGFNPLDTPFSANADVNQDFGIAFPDFTGYLEYTGEFIQFPVEVLDTPNTYSVNTYVVPFTGLYTFNARIFSDLAEPFLDTRTAYATIMHYDSTDQFITQYPGAFVTEPNIGIINASVAATFVCNAGDQIRVNFYSKLNTAGPVGTEQIIPSYTIDGVTFYTTFNGNGINLLPTNLDPVNEDDVQAYVYKFNRPLTMNQINAILDETARPIKLGRHNDPLRVVDTYIKNMNIQSVLRKAAEFEVKSNKLIQ